MEPAEEEGSPNPGGDVGVFTPYPLAKGSCIFGPFKVREVKVRVKSEGTKEERLGEQEEDVETKEEQLDDSVLEVSCSLVWGSRLGGGRCHGSILNKKL